MEIDNAWVENAFITKANFLHERVHNPDNSYISRGKRVFTAVWVFNDKYDIYGITDCIEAKESNHGVAIDNTDKKYELTIVEYKPKKPSTKEYNDEDAMQIFAQKLCVDAIFKTNCKAVLYYADVKKRVEIDFNKNFAEYEEKLKSILSDMRYNIDNSIIPPIVNDQKCSGCSFKDICLPTVRKNHSNIREVIESILSKDV